MKKTKFKLVKTAKGWAFEPVEGGKKTSVFNSKTTGVKTLLMEKLTPPDQPGISAQNAIDLVNELAVKTDIPVFDEGKLNDEDIPVAAEKFTKKVKYTLSKLEIIAAGEEVYETGVPRFLPCSSCGKHGYIVTKEGPYSINSKEEGYEEVADLLKEKRTDKTNAEVMNTAIKASKMQDNFYGGDEMLGLLGLLFGGSKSGVQVIEVGVLRV